MSQTILSIEDDPDIREILAFNLTREGFRVLEAEDGIAGLALARKEHPDLIREFPGCRNNISE